MYVLKMQSLEQARVHPPTTSWLACSQPIVSSVYLMHTCWKGDFTMYRHNARSMAINTVVRLGVLAGTLVNAL